MKIHFKLQTEYVKIVLNKKEELPQRTTNTDSNSSITKFLTIVIPLITSIINLIQSLK